ncbi:MAG: bifunctional phosphopantothenoylcysteine decarboxylase/phosphopantothenate--cysteine ligase CoaBC [Lachnospiraceae bacterium]|nr:bifunctional phosphopantothenoylcysteine decarboxylase/phosphopantothenate--cysteine ligase CoaBC [Lachnospiraceae bacterium]
MLKNKTVVIGVTGSIAAYKMANVVSMLVKLGADVHVIMTRNAVNFINPITFETLTGNKCLIDTFDRNFEFKVGHVGIAAKADIFLIAPATANIIGKIANGIADDMLSTTVMAAKCPVFVAPAMNNNMYDNKIVQRNIKLLEEYGYGIIMPATGYLACGATGTGKLADENTLVEHIVNSIAREKDMSGKTILVTAGPTIEKIDPVRYITNHSSGKMGYAVAKTAVLRGAKVILVSGPVHLTPPSGCEVVPVESAADMYDAVLARGTDCDIIIKCAAVADYRPKTVAGHKLKKSDSDSSIELERTEDILKYLGENRKSGQIICGFSMETDNLIENSRQKLIKKNVDMIVANSINDEGAGFKTDTNKVTLITKSGEKELPLMTKEETADAILTALLNM